MLCAARDAMQEAIPLPYFEALFDDPVEAQAQHAMHESRIRFENRRREEDLL